MARRHLCNLRYDDVAPLPCVLGNPSQGLGGCAADNTDTGCFIVRQPKIAFENRRCLNQRGSSTGDDAFFDRGTGSRNGVFDAMLLLLQLHLGVASDTDDNDTTGKFRKPLLQLLAIPI